MLKIKICLLTALLALSGCAGFTKAKPPVTKYVFVIPATELIQDCKVLPPPEAKGYSVSSPEKKEALLYSFSLAQLDAMAQCHKQQASLRIWYSDQQRVYLTK